MSKTPQIQLFDVDGNPVDMAAIIRDYLKENLSVSVDTSKECDFANSDLQGDYTLVEVTILLGDEEISKSSSRIS